MAGDGMVSREEWVSTFQQEFHGSKEQAYKMFTKLDRDASGGMSLQELQQLFLDMDIDGKYQLIVRN